MNKISHNKFFKADIKDFCGKRSHKYYITLNVIRIQGIQNPETVGKPQRI